MFVSEKSTKFLKERMMNSTKIFVSAIMLFFTTALCFCDSAFAEYLEVWGRNNYGQRNVPDSNDFVAVAAGANHNLALRSDGSIIAWHYNDYSLCNNVPAGNGFIAIASGNLHSLALKSDGSLVAWGYNYYGQCDVPVGNDFVYIAAGSYHNVAIRSDGSLTAWGQNNNGQCDVPTGNDFIEAAAGTHHNLAIKSDGTIVAWGTNTYGQLDVPSGTFIAVAAGAWHSVAIRSDGSLAEWGKNSYKNTFGNGYYKVAARNASESFLFREPLSSFELPDGNDFIAIATGSYHNLALRSDGSLAAWGYNSDGQCDVPVGNGFAAISAGDYHSLALRSKICTNPIIGDLNGDCKVDCDDITIIIQNWLECNLEPPEACY
jgi:alpha-tubulin suppressor-like RCC1 family protein